MLKNMIKWLSDALGQCRTIGVDFYFKRRRGATTGGELGSALDGLDWEGEERDPRYDIPKEMTTCYHCDIYKTCRYAWDAYNTDGDCLASK